MPYRYAREREDYGDFAAGPVLYSRPGRPAFPVRLASEIFQRCRAHLLRAGSRGPYTVYDPCCGSAYLLVTLAFLHRPDIRALLASDVDPEAIPLAERNLALLTPEGMAARVAQLDALYRAYGKESHAEALARVRRLAARLEARRALPALERRAFVADALDGAEVAANIAPGAVDIVITDAPYGQRTSWQGADAPHDAGPLLLAALHPALAPVSVVAITTDKQPRFAHPAYERIEQLQVGKRRTLLFAPQ